MNSILKWFFGVCWDVDKWMEPFCWMNIFLHLENCAGIIIIILIASFYPPIQTSLIQTLVYNSVLTGLEFKCMEKYFHCPLHWFLIDYSVTVFII